MIFFALFLEAHGIQSIPVQLEQHEIDMIMEYDAPGGPEMWICYTDKVKF